MTASELRQMYIRFFEERGHQAIASASLLPENDPSVLFTTAGMHPLIPYLLGGRHPLGKRLVDVQKCIRTCDIDEVGDATHLTFFEMLGNWSLGDYFKTEVIAMSYEFLTARLHIPGNKLAVTVFAGDDKAPRDQESYQLWKNQGLTESQIFFYGREENWWGPAGVTGPCGPDTEIFYDTGRPVCGENCGPACHCGKYIEIWNNVFMAYYRNDEGSFSLLAQKNVDTGMGLERVLMIMNGQTAVYQTELFVPIIAKIEEMAGLPISDDHEKSCRILSDHLRAAVFILGDPKAIKPGNSEQGYILRRLIRRAIRHGKKIGADGFFREIAEQIIFMYGEAYPELVDNKIHILSELRQETALFARTLDNGLKRAAKYFAELAANSQGSEPALLPGELAFRLYDTYGFPIEFTQELASEKGMSVDMEGFDCRFRAHQLISRLGSEAKFRGGMADYSEQTTRLHTATHLLNGALRMVLGEGIYQKGSNITPERLRFDFSFERKLTDEELEKISGIVNEAIRNEVEVVCEERTVEEAKRSGAIGVFNQKYGERVKVYTIDGYSKEICGGPHVANTCEVGFFRIIKEESSSAGVRRIRAEAGT